MFTSVLNNARGSYAVVPLANQYCVTGSVLQLAESPEKCWFSQWKRE